MGGKQSTDSTSANRNTRNNATTSAHTSHAIAASRRNNHTVTSLDSGTRNPALSFNNADGLVRNVNRSHARSEHRSHRANSNAETGIRFSRPGFEWFYAAHLPDSDSSPEDGNAGSSSRNLPPFASYSGNLSRSLPPYFFRPNRGKWMLVLVSKDENLATWC